MIAFTTNRMHALTFATAAICVFLAASGCGSGGDNAGDDQVTTVAADPPQSAPPQSDPPMSAPRMLPTGEAESVASDLANENVSNPDADVSNVDTDVESDVESNAPVAEDASEPESIADVIAKTFAAPAGAKPLSDSRVWIDRDRARVYADGYIAMNQGPLEMFACPAGTKEHESIVATLGRASEIHAGLLAVGAQVGTPVSYNPKFVPATGQRIRIWVCYFDQDGEFKVVDARDWIQDIGTNETLKEDWVFAGSFIYEDPTDNRKYYQGDIGDMICVSNFTTATLDIPVLSSAETDRLQYIPNTPQIPKPDTPVRLILEPIPLPSDDQEVPSEPKPPTAEVLQKVS